MQNSALEIQAILLRNSIPFRLASKEAYADAIAHGAGFMSVRYCLDTNAIVADKVERNEVLKG